MSFHLLIWLVVEDSVVLSGPEWIRFRLARTILKHPFTHSRQITLNLSPVEQIAWTTDFPVCWRIDEALKSAGQCKANFWRERCSYTGFSVAQAIIPQQYHLLRMTNFDRWWLNLFVQEQREWEQERWRIIDSSFYSVSMIWSYYKTALFVL